MPNSKIQEVFAHLRSQATRAGILSPKIERVDGADTPTFDPDSIRILSEEVKITWGELATDEEFAQAIVLINESIQEVTRDDVVNLTELQSLRTNYGRELAPKVIISAEMNQQSAKAFCQRVRQNLHQIIDTPTVMSENTDFTWIDLVQLSERWNIPLKLVRFGSNPMKGGHYTLALKNPERTTDGTWKVLIYDPLMNGERWAILPEGWQSSYDLGVVVLSNRPSVQEGEYDLTVQGDAEFAQQSEIIQAKMTRMQFDFSSCGPACLLAAAIRTAFSPEWNSFKHIDREVLEKDTESINAQGESIPGIKVYTREEIFGQE